MADLFGRATSTIVTPLTADQATLIWGNVVTNAVQVSVSYNQPINRRRTIGNQDAVIWAGMPSGQINITQLMTTNAAALFASPGWNACSVGTITLALGGGCNQGTSLTLTATGCIVAGFNTSLESESLSVLDNVVIEFLQLSES